MEGCNQRAGLGDVPARWTYGYICEPHYGLGMVGLVLVGDYGANLETAQSIRQRGRAAQRFRDLFRQTAAMPAGHAVGAVPPLPPEATPADAEDSPAEEPDGSTAPHALEPAEEPAAQ